MFFTGCQKDTSYFEEEGIFFNRGYRVKYESERLLTQEIDAELIKINQSLNLHNPGSVIAKVNRNEEVEVDSLFITIFNKSQEISRKTDGAFDVTCAPLISLWGFDLISSVDNVTPEMVDSVKQFVDYRKVRLEGNRIVKDDPRLKLNFAAIVKGYSCDLLGQLFEKHGVKNYMIDVGNEILVKGLDEGRKTWQVGIRTPEAGKDERSVTIMQNVYLKKKKAFANSGDYQYYYIKDGKKYAHMISPKTGYPADQNILSGTVLADDCMTADGYSTAFVSLGLEKAVPLADSLPELDYFFIYTDDKDEYRFKSSKGMERFLSDNKK